MNYHKDKHKCKRTKKLVNENIFIYIALVITAIGILLFQYCSGENFRPYIRKYSKKNNIPQWVTYRIIEAESSYNKYAVSPKKAIGLMGILPKGGLKDYWRLTKQYRRKIMIFDILMLFSAENNIKIGCKYYAWLLKYHKGDVYKALNSYNMGLSRTRKGIYNISYLHKITRVDSDRIRQILYPYYKIAYMKLFERGE